MGMDERGTIFFFTFSVDNSIPLQWCAGSGGECTVQVEVSTVVNLRNSIVVTRLSLGTIVKILSQLQGNLFFQFLIINSESIYQCKKTYINTFIYNIRE